MDPLSPREGTDPVRSRAKRSYRQRVAGTLNTLLPPAALLVGLLVLWQTLITRLGVQPYFAPHPSEIAKAMWSQRDLLISNGWTTLKEVMIGFVVALAFGVVLAVAIAESRLLRRAIFPLVVGSQTVPIVAIAPLIILWFGYGIWSKVCVAALISFFPIVVNTATGLRSLDDEMIRLMRSFPANRWRIFAKAKAPAALPHFFAGVKIAMVLCVIGAVIGEFVGSDSGLGSFIIQRNAQLQTADVFAAIVTLSLMGIALFVLVGVVERLIIPWYFAAREVGE